MVNFGFCFASGVVRHGWSLPPLIPLCGGGGDLTPSASASCAHALLTASYNAVMWGGVCPSFATDGVDVGSLNEGGQPFPRFPLAALALA